jgi:hypothetical protein
MSMSNMAVESACAQRQPARSRPRLLGPAAAGEEDIARRPAHGLEVAEPVVDGKPARLAEEALGGRSRQRAPPGS